jgi:hypothetical protein
LPGTAAAIRGLPRHGPPHPLAPDHHRPAALKIRVAWHPQLAPP